MNARVLEAMVNMLLRQWPVVWAANLALITVCGVVLAPFYPHSYVFGWCATNYLLFILRVREWHRFRHTDLRSEQALKAWLYEYSAYALIGGLIWGIGALAHWRFLMPMRPIVWCFCSWQCSVSRQVDCLRYQVIFRPMPVSHALFCCLSLSSLHRSSKATQRFSAF